MYLRHIQERLALLLTVTTRPTCLCTKPPSKDGGYCSSLYNVSANQCFTINSCIVLIDSTGEGIHQHKSNSTASEKIRFFSGSLSWGRLGLLSETLYLELTPTAHKINKAGEMSLQGKAWYCFIPPYWNPFGWLQIQTLIYSHIFPPDCREPPVFSEVYLLNWVINLVVLKEY